MKFADLILLLDFAPNENTVWSQNQSPKYFPEED